MQHESIGNKSKRRSPFCSKGNWSMFAVAEGEKEVEKEITGIHMTKEREMKDNKNTTYTDPGNAK